MTGLICYDMTAFFAYCVTATSYCDSDAYNAEYFDGWSLGAYLALTTATAKTSTELFGACLESQTACFGFYTDSTGEMCTSAYSL